MCLKLFFEEFSANFIKSNEKVCFQNLVSVLFYSPSIIGSCRFFDNGNFSENFFSLIFDNRNLNNNLLRIVLF